MTRGFCVARGTIMKKFRTKLRNRLCLHYFLQQELKCSAKPRASCCMINCALISSPLPNCYIQIYHVEYNYLEILGRILSFCFTKPVHPRNTFNNAPVLRNAIAMDTNSAFTGSYTENSLWYQHFCIRQIRIHRGTQPVVDFDTANDCSSYVTTMKAITFQADISSVPIDNFKFHYVMVFALT